MPSAIVAGATGILGRAILFEIASKPETWTKVFALSRSSREDYPKNVQHQHLDLLDNANEMAKSLVNIEAEYVFFAAYIAKDDEGEASDVNGALLRNFLTALRVSGAEKKLKRVVLVTGAKQYALHLGRPKSPMEESDPWVEGPDWPPNFYYTQQSILKELSEQGSWDWVVTYPNDVIGFVKNNFMNLSTPLALYARVNKELGQDLVWPGSPAFYAAHTTFTSAKLHAKFCRWVVDKSEASNQGFNVVDGDVVSWQSMWPRLASRFGLKVAPDQLTRSLPYEGSTTLLREEPPITLWARKMGIEGSSLLEQSKIENRISLAKWSQRSEIREAWKRLATEQGLDEAIWDRATWAFCDFILGRNFDIVISQTKARSMGWTGFQDTWKALDETWTEMEIAKQLPKP